MSDLPRPCPACGVDNPVDRELCGRCGVDLFTGGMLPAPAQREAPDPPRPEPSREHHRWAVPLVAVLVGVALLVVGLTWAGFGPLADRSDVPPATFADGRYPGDTAPLGLATVAASEADPATPPQAMADGDPATAWRSAGPPTPVAAGQVGTVLATLQLGLREPAWIDRLVLRNGDHRDAEAYESAARIARLRVRTDAGEAVFADLLDLGLEPQQVVFDEPLLATELRLDLLEVFPGDEDEPVALAEIELFGWSADAEDAELARARREARSTVLDGAVGARARTSSATGAGQPS